MLASMPSDCSRESSEWSSEVVWDFVEAFDEVELAATAAISLRAQFISRTASVGAYKPLRIYDGIRIGEQLRDIIGFRTIVFGSGKRNQALRSGFMTIADVKRRMTEGTRGEHLHREPHLIFRSSHGCKRIRIDIKRVNAIAS